MWAGVVSPGGDVRVEHADVVVLEQQRVVVGSGEQRVELVHARRPYRYARAMVSRDAVLAALAQVVDPELKRPVTELDMVRAVEIDGGARRRHDRADRRRLPAPHSFEQQVTTRCCRSTGVEIGRARLRRDEPGGEDRARHPLARRRRAARDLARPAHARDRGRERQGRRRQVVADRQPRGAFDALGERVGILDADVYGHSIPHMLGVHQRPVVVDKMIVPPVRGDLKLMSIGFFLDDNAPVMWRGPMLHRALEQFL